MELVGLSVCIRIHLEGLFTCRPPGSVTGFWFWGSLVRLGDLLFLCCPLLPTLLVEVPPLRTTADLALATCQLEPAAYMLLMHHLGPCQKCSIQGTLLHCWWECKLGQPLQRTVWRFLKKVKIELLYDPAIPLLGIYLEKKCGPKRCVYRTPVFTAALFTTAKTWKQPKCPSTEEWIKTRWCMHTVEYYSAIKWMI